MDLPLAIANENKINVFSPAKIILVGEHAVIYGAKAVAIPLMNMTLNLRFSPLAFDRNGGAQIDLKMNSHEVEPLIYQVIESAFGLLGRKCSVAIDGFSKIPIGAGLGSSASLCVGLLRGLSQMMGQTLSELELCRYAHQLETFFHGNPSGLDTTVVAKERCISYRKTFLPNDPYEFKNISPKGMWDFVLIDTKSRSSTAHMIQVSKNYFSIDLGLKLRFFNEMAAMVETALTQNDKSMMAAAFMRADLLLRQAGVVTQELSDVVRGCVESGAVAAKTTGAGGGGCVLALVSGENVLSVIQKLKILLPKMDVFHVQYF